MFAGRLAALVAIVAALGLFVFPFATVYRSFDGPGTLLLFPGRLLDFSGFQPENIPNFGTTLGLGWAAFALLLLTAFAGLARQSWLWIAGLLTTLIALATIVTFEGTLGVPVRELVAQGTPLRRIPFATGAANLGMSLPIAAGLVGLIAGLAAYPGPALWLDRLRGALVPLASLLLTAAVGTIVLLIVEPVPSGLGAPLSAAQQWFGKVDLVWFVYTTLFSPLTNLGDFVQSLMLATPLIFTGLSVAFAFRAGLFNVGAPGQMVMGAIFAMLAGVYLPLPPVLLMPATILAAALGGGLWGAIPGFLKARFGSSEVINTIMLNYIASGLLVFLIGSSTFPFFGREVSLPFKAPGYEARSHELQPGAQLPSLPQLFGLGSDGGSLSWAPLLGLAVFAVLFLLLRRERLRMWIGLTAGVLVTLITWGLLSFPVNTQGVAESHLNVAFFFAIGAAVVFGILLWRTSVGYELRAVGLSPKAAQYGGINVARNTVLAMTIAGALAGLSATHYVQGAALDEYRLKQSLPTNVGFDGIAVALLGLSTPAGVVASGVFFGVLDTGGLYLDQRLTVVDRDIVTVLKALLVLFIAAKGFLSRRILNPVALAITPPAQTLPQRAKENV